MYTVNEQLERADAARLECALNHSVERKVGLSAEAVRVCQVRLGEEYATSYDRGCHDVRDSRGVC